MGFLQRVYALAAKSERRGIPPEELLARGALHPDGDGAGGITRRSFAVGGAGLIAAAALGRARERRTGPASAGETPSIAIVGAGLAGTRCAHMLWNEAASPIAATLYEANTERAGGRCWTLRDYFDGGLVTEHGGSFINTNHQAMIALAGKLGLELEVVNDGNLPSGEEAWWIDGAHYTQAEATADWASVGFEAFREAVRLQRTPAGEARLDALSVLEWLDSTEIKASSRLGKLCLANSVGESGADPSEQSALDLIELTAASPRHNFELLPEYDEKFHVAGGNDQIISRMIAQLPPEAIQHGHQLVALRANQNGSSTLTFDVAGGSTIEMTVDRVVLALPFSTLRKVDLTKSGLTAEKLKVIRTLGMGANAKVHLELTRKTWPALGFSGVAIGEWDGFCEAWDDCVPLGRDASPALLLGFPGGKVARSELTGAAHGVAPGPDVGWFLNQIEPVYPGTTAAYTGRAYEDHWALDPWVEGAYSYARVGQASTYTTIAAASEGHLHFAGEHTSIKFQGFMEGAVETGERAARQLIRRRGASRAPR